MSALFYSYLFWDLIHLILQEAQQHYLHKILSILSLYISVGFWCVYCGNKILGTWFSYLFWNYSLLMGMLAPFTVNGFPLAVVSVYPLGICFLAFPCVFSLSSPPFGLIELIYFQFPFHYSILATHFYELLKNSIQYLIPY